MSYFRYAFPLALKQRWKGLSSLPLLLTVILLAVLLILPGAEDSAVVQVGLVLPEDGGEELYRLLDSRGSQLVAFIPTDEETLNRKILTGHWDCGLVVPEDFRQRLEEGDTDRILTLKTVPGSTVYPLVRETAAACLVELMTPYIAGDYLREIGAGDASLSAQLEELAEHARPVEIQLETLDGREMEPLALADSGGRNILQGLFSLGTVLWGLYLSMDLGKWLFSAPVIRLRSVRRDSQLLLPQAAGAMAPLLVLGFVFLPFLGGWRSAALYPLFWLTVLGMVLVICRISPLWRAVPVLMPFLTVGALIFEPVLVTALLFPGLAPWLGWLPVGLFLRACDGNVTAGLGLLAEAAVLAFLSRAADHLPRKKAFHKV